MLKCVPHLLYLQGCLPCFLQQLDNQRCWKNVCFRSLTEDKILAADTFFQLKDKRDERSWCYWCVTFCVRGTFRLNGQSHHTLALDIFLAVKKSKCKRRWRGREKKRICEMSLSAFHPTNWNACLLVLLPPSQGLISLPIVISVINEYKNDIT